MSVIENRDKDLAKLYQKADEVKTEYGWPKFIETEGGLSGGFILGTLQTALRALVFCEKNYRNEEGLLHKTDVAFIIPFAILYSMYCDHFKKYLPDEEVPSIKDVAQAYVKEVEDKNIHEVSNEIN